MPVVALAEQCGLLTPADEHLTVPNDKGANAGRKVASLVGAMLGGADSIADTAVLRHGAMGTIFDRPYVPSTLGSFLREFSFGHVRQLDAVASRMLCALSERMLGLATRTVGGNPEVGRRARRSVDYNSTDNERHRHADAVIAELVRTPVAVSAACSATSPRKHSPPPSSRNSSPAQASPGPTWTTSSSGKHRPTVMHPRSDGSLPSTQASTSTCPASKSTADADPDCKSRSVGLHAGAIRGSDLVLADCVGSMSQAEFYATVMRWDVKAESVALSDRRARVTAGGKNYPVPGRMIETAENLSAEFFIWRADQDALAASSHQKAVAAQNSGVFPQEIVGV